MRGMLEIAERFGVAVVGPETRDLLERQARAGGDDEAVIRNPSPSAVTTTWRSRSKPSAAVCAKRMPLRS